MATKSKPGEDRIRRRYELRGRVQGVGFRPWIYRLAVEEGLAGHVGNDPRGAFVEAEGPPAALARFEERLMNEWPPLVQIADRRAIDLPPAGDAAFVIAPSDRAGERRAEITPDTAVCADCRRELLDPADRRHRYPFINCTNCGPRYSIIRGVPYDRERTTMAAFAMCPDCRREYEDPADRRFHAQPDACPVCGPRAWLADAAGNVLTPADEATGGGEAVAEAARRLAAGAILAVKGLGGFHLACRADDDAVVLRLRARKSREAKPLALMVRDLDAARRLVELDKAAEAALASPAHPIVLAAARPDAPVSRHVAPGSDTLGVMLPYTPLHVLLFETELPGGGRLGSLVMTSGNPSAEPLCADNDEARSRLGAIADAFLLHDRDIERRVDDSVVASLALPEPGGAPVPALFPLRRARGYVPAPVVLAGEVPMPILAVGAELKSTVCLAAGREAVLSEHLGDLDNPETYRNFLSAVARLQNLLDIEPAAVACDLHPDYQATRWARSLDLPRVEVQHHHAHVVACLAEHHLDGEVMGLAIDGTGWGPDGTVWGCELLAAGAADYRRAGHLRPFPLLGGDAAARETWRPALALLGETYGDDLPAAAQEAFARIEPRAAALARRRLAAQGERALRTSSLGRLFDAAAFLLGIRDANRHEAEAPMALEAEAVRAAGGDAAALGLKKAPEPAPLPWSVAGGAGGIVLDVRPLVAGMVDGFAAGRPAGELAYAFHLALSEMLAAGTAAAARDAGLERVVLTGGSFANRILLARVRARLRAAGLRVYIHHLVPPGDGGVSLGQAVSAAARLERDGR